MASPIGVDESQCLVAKIAGHSWRPRRTDRSRNQNCKCNCLQNFHCRIPHLSKGSPLAGFLLTQTPKPSEYSADDIDTASLRTSLITQTTFHRNASGRETASSRIPLITTDRKQRRLALDIATCVSGWHMAQAPLQHDGARPRHAIAVAGFHGSRSQTPEDFPLFPVLPAICRRQPPAPFRAARISGNPFN